MEPTKQIYATLPVKPTEQDIERGVTVVVGLAKKSGATSSFAGELPKGIDGCRIIKSGPFEVRFIESFDPSKGENGEMVAIVDTFIA